MSPGKAPSSNPTLSAERIEIARRHAEKVLASKAFAGSKRSQDFLRLIVEHTLAGQTDNLRERMIGAEMFGRPIDYDTANDSVVRVKANEVRRRLAQYYADEGTERDPVWIDLSIGTYVPEFRWEPVRPTTEEPSPVTQIAPASARRLSVRGWTSILAAAVAGAVVSAIAVYSLTKVASGPPARTRFPQSSDIRFGLYNGRRNLAGRTSTRICERSSQRGQP